MAQDGSEYVVEVCPIGDISVNADGTSGYCIEDGVYLKVNPPVGDGEGIKAQDVKDKLDYKRVEDVDEDALERAIASTETVSVKIAPYQQEVKYSATLTVEITKDNLAAYAVMIPPTGIC